MKKKELKIETTSPLYFKLLCISLSIVFIFILGSCASHKATSPQTLRPEFPPYTETIDKVTLSCKTLSEEECRTIFNRNIIDWGYQPAQITIKNDTERYMLFPPQGVSLPVYSPQEVANKFHTYGDGVNSTAMPEVFDNAGIGGLIFTWPFVIANACTAIADAKRSLMNAAIDRKFKELNLENLLIEPYTEHSGIIFISNDDFKDSFFVNLVDKESNEKIKYHVKGLKNYHSGEKTFIVDPAEPWTGSWDIKYYRGGGNIFVLKQNGKEVKSTSESCWKLSGKINRKTFKGWIEINNRRLSCSLIISSNYQSLTGWIKTPGGKARAYSLILGKRIEDVIVEKETGVVGSLVIANPIKIWSGI